MSKAKKKTKSKKRSSSSKSKKRMSLTRGMEGMMRDVMNAVGGTMSFRHAGR